MLDRREEQYFISDDYYAHSFDLKLNNKMTREQFVSEFVKKSKTDDCVSIKKRESEMSTKYIMKRNSLIPLSVSFNNRYKDSNRNLLEQMDSAYLDKKIINRNSRLKKILLTSGIILVGTIVGKQIMNSIKDNSDKVLDNTEQETIVDLKNVIETNFKNETSSLENMSAEELKEKISKLDEQYNEQMLKEVEEIKQYDKVYEKVK